MDGSDNNRSNISVAVTVASDTEPVECDGCYRATDGGFVLEFGTETCDYIITRDRDSVKLAANGELSYVLDFSDRSATHIKAECGCLDAELTPTDCSVAETPDGVTLDLSYKLAVADIETVRRVVVTAKFC